MSRLDLDTGRKNQKLRTRRALLAAARHLMEEGQEPSVDDVAEQAMVSRATAYRYFASTEQLVLEATLDADFYAEPLDGAALPADVVERAAHAQAFLYEHAGANETQFRLFLSSTLRASLEEEPMEVRGGRRLPMIEEALAPARDDLGEEAYRRLVHALAGMVGIESLVVMRDVCQLDHAEAKATMAWAVRTLVAAALAEAAG
jgi:AcrR family transcriptional regulator